MARRPLSRPWTAEETALVANLFRAGKSYDQIARQLKRSSSAVRRHARLAQSKRQPGASGPALDGQVISRVLRVS